jgi:hypothetical protein
MRAIARTSSSRPRGAAQSRDETVGRKSRDGAPQQQRLQVLERDDAARLR